LTSWYTLKGIPVQGKLLPRSERRAAILRGAALAFAGAGFAQTSMEDVAVACGVTKLILYRHFSSKEELYRAILQQVFDRLGEELGHGLALGPTSGLGARTLLTVAREEPAAFRLLWRHAAREPQFAAYAGELRSASVGVVRTLARLDSGDDVFDTWMAEALFGWLVEATLSWLDHGEAARDDEFVERTTHGLRALRSEWAPVGEPRP